MKVKKTLLLALLAGFVTSVLAVSGEAAVQKNAAAAQKKKKRKRLTAEERFAKLDVDPKNDHVSKKEWLAGNKGKRAKNAERRWKRMVKFAKDAKLGLTLEEFKKASVRKRKKKKGNA
jgi:hypothetical protein